MASFVEGVWFGKSSIRRDGNLPIVISVDGLVVYELRWESQGYVPFHVPKGLMDRWCCHILPDKLQPHREKIFILLPPPLTDILIIQVRVVPWLYSDAAVSDGNSNVCQTSVGPTNRAVVVPIANPSAVRATLIIVLAKVTGKVS